LFAVALVTIGVALVMFAWSWKEFAFGLGRARAAGIASALFGTTSGLAFAGIALAPLDLALRLHNGLVIAAFSLLLGYVAMLTLLMWRNRIVGLPLAANLSYLLLLCGYLGLVLWGPRLFTERGFAAQVLGQKIVVYGSMAHIIYLTTTVRARLRASSE
jgi:hypothetical protein